jgi:hypothetical protein
MKNASMVGLVLLLISGFISPIHGSEEELPDNYLPFSLDIQENQLKGKCEFLEGFTISMILPEEFIKKGFDYTELKNFVQNKKITGTLTYPKGRTTQINYEVVNHRGTNNDIYMKTSLGYFLWERVNIQNGKLSFAIYWWYCPPARPVDLEILELARSLLANPENWHKTDDRKCEDDIDNNKWSLFCALKHASIEKTKEYNHHNTALQAVRFTIDEIKPNHGFEHSLMDYNNLPATTHGDILRVLKQAIKKIKKELDSAGK